MADDVQDTQEQIEEATSLGWAPKEKWRGPEDKWVPAHQFLEKGMGIHHLRDENRALKGKLGAAESQLSELTVAVRSANAAIEALQESAAEDVKAQVEAAREDLKAEITRASREGDHEALADATVKLTELNTAEKDNKQDTQGGGGDDTAPRIHPEIKQWFSDNPDFARDSRRIALSNVAAIELRKEGITEKGAAFMDLMAARVDEMLGGAAAARGTSKVEPGGRGGRQSGGGGGKTYADLPAEAKAACEKMAPRLVGPNRAHKDTDSWRKSYAKQYFAGE